MKTNNSNKNVTKVICSNCGAEILIPNNEVKNVIGTVVGKNSGLGTIALPTVGTVCGSTTSPGKMTKQRALAQLQSLAEVNPEMKSMVETILSQIDEGGYIDVQGIVRRWIPSQCLHMLHSSCGFHRALNNKGYYYSWDVVLTELKKQVKLTKDKDFEELKDRQRWYSKQMVVDMAVHYVSELKKYMEYMPVKKHQGRKYIRLVCWLNNGKGVHTDEFNKVLDPLYNAQISIFKAENCERLVDCVQSFVKIAKTVESWKPTSQAPSFMNAYKAAGAYYTIKDLILFEGCRMKVDAFGNTDKPNYFSKMKTEFVDKEKSLEALESKVADMVKYDNINDCGYMLLGLLKHFLVYNNFDYKNTLKSWADASKERKMARLTGKARRSRK